MNTRLSFSLLLLAGLVASLGAAPAAGQDSPPPALTPPALTPEVQTAEWAKSWWMPRHEEKLAQKKQMERVDLVLIGDSITHGWENAGKPVWEKHFANVATLNLGFSGDRTEQVLWRLDHGELDQIAPKLAVVMIGTNNTGHRQDPAEQTAAGVQAILKRIQKLSPTTKILLLAIFPRGAAPEDRLRKLNDEINQRIAGLADNERIFFLDINDKFLDDKGELPRSIMPDLLHPNEDGYRIWAENMQPMIEKLTAQ